MRAGLARVGGEVRPAGVPSRKVAQPPRIHRGYCGLVPAAELLIRLARVEDQPGDLVRDGQDSYHRASLVSLARCMPHLTADGTLLA